jgi:Zn-dependent protease
MHRHAGSKGASRLRWLLTMVITLAALLAAASLYVLVEEVSVPSTTIVWFWVSASVLSLVLWFVLRRLRSTRAVPVSSRRRVLPPEEQPEPIKEVMEVATATEEGGIKIFRGRLRSSAALAYAKLKNAFSGWNIPLIQEDRNLGTSIALLPAAELASTRKRFDPALHIGLFVLTMITTTWAGALYQGIDLVAHPERFVDGVHYSFGLLAILGVHELGHYFLARQHGMQVTPPYFIPVPFALGTFGAFIRMRSPAENRRMLFDVAVAGPLAGLAIAIPALIIGLQSSTIVPGIRSQSMGILGGTTIDSSILFALISKLSLGEAVNTHHVLKLSPLAFAGWLGLLVTALNLLPIGQLDGGHIARAVFGLRVGSMISAATMAGFFLLAVFVWPNLLVWSLVVFFIAGRGTPPLNDITRLTPGRRWLAAVALLILLIILAPYPDFV